MKQTYHVAGMTCNSCRGKVEQALTTVTGVTKATVDLEKSQAIVESSQAMSSQILQASLADKFTISKLDDKPVSQDSANTPSELRQLLPLFLIFGYITISAFLLNRAPWSIAGFMLDFMGLFYIVFSFFKLLDLKGFPQSFRMYDPLAKILPAYGWIYPFIELALGVMFLNRLFIQPALITTIIILGITTIGVTKTLLDKKAIQCACLGTALKLPMTKATFIENSIMLVMAVAMFIVE